MTTKFKLIYEATVVEDNTKVRKLFISNSGIPDVENDEVLVLVDDLIYEDKAANKKYVAIYVASGKASDGTVSYQVVGKTAEGVEKIIIASDDAPVTDITTAVLDKAILDNLILE